MEYDKRDIYLPERNFAFVFRLHKHDANPVNHLPEGSDDEL